MPSTYATAFAAHHARGSMLRPRDTTFRRGDTMVHRPTMLRPRDTMVHRPTMLRARDTTTTMRSTQVPMILALQTVLTMRVPETPPLPHTKLGRGSRFGEVTLGFASLPFKLCASSQRQTHSATNSLRSGWISAPGLP